jgi:TonB family protein
MLSKGFGVTWRFWFCALVLAALPALARADDPILAHYRTYQQALEARDGPRVLSAAEAAFAASKARDGDGGQTAILAYNLAEVRLRFGQAMSAVEPAREALRMSTARADTGLNPIGARLILGRALTLANDASGPAALKAALDEAVANKNVEAHFVFPAAVLRGKTAYDMKRWRDASEAWALAVATANGAERDPDIARASALSWEAGSLVMADRVAEGYERIVRSVALFRPFMIETSGPEATDLEKAYGAVLAWSAAVRARLITDGESAQARAIMDRETRAERPGLAGKAPLCPIVLQQTPRIRYPTRAQNDVNIGGVAVRFGVAPDGQLRNVRVLASVAGADAQFEKAILEAMPRWRAEKSPNAPNGCRIESDSHFQTFSFAF